ncbi:xanthine dehydrogenase YagR molybdenum-binding subunit [Prauserella aidingensis]|uniref:xanthine dehydrogenase family protein molybdopterin-binding subunit n=1 Tax=Prauserella aidingensis TaxID=387890 RepID=UPI0020A33CAF|nr:xanthine dehydrogenase family protein molybdopterin-binding subunit [Prauserella aidingensis]MCP2252649.1 xanthine dehydrogenase YagR molybdenum-binding subunit [Prauserella aidingensis]
MTRSIEPVAAVGTAPERVDGRAKVAGKAPYAYEHPVERPAYAHPIQATIPAGRIRRIDTGRALAVSGVHTVLTPDNAPPLRRGQDGELEILQDADVAFRGQIIGCVVADTPEAARHAADLVAVDYERRDHDVTLTSDRSDLYRPGVVNPSYETDTEDGDVDAALAGAAARVDAEYRTARNHNNPLEPHTTVAVWDADGLTLHDSTQGVHSLRSVVAGMFDLDESRIRVLAPYVGGGFGSKGTAHAHVVLAALAAKRMSGRPVKLALTRQQTFTLAGYRTPTVQRVALGADTDGRIDALAVDVVEQTSRIKEFAEQTGVPSRTMYAARHRRTTHRMAALDVPVPSWMRAPGVCPGMFGPEVAMDELAERCGLDPIELRLRNEPDRDPETGKPYSTRNLAECLRVGARRSGWDGRPAEPRQTRRGEWWVGTGVASSTYPVHHSPGSAARIERGVDGRYHVSVGAVDIGTGAWTVLGQIAADALGVDRGDVVVTVGDTALPFASVAGGSSGTANWGSAIVAAAHGFRARFGDDDPPAGSEHTESAPENPDTERFAMHAFGAQFAEVHVSADTGEIRVPRLLGVFAAGRIVNPRLARSQFLGGMTMGLSMALHEDGVMDERLGMVVNHDLAEYHVATNADVPSVEAEWIDEHDPHVNAMGTKGIGEIGIVGTAAAVANAAYHATGVRVRDLPVTADRFLTA